MPLESVDHVAPDVRVEGEGNRTVALADTWRDRAAVLVFLRHFG